MGGKNQWIFLPLLFAEDGCRLGKVTLEFSPQETEISVTGGLRIYQIDVYGG